MNLYILHVLQILYYHDHHYHRRHLHQQHHHHYQHHIIIIIIIIKISLNNTLRIGAHALATHGFI
jgi:hypothetical protein